MGVESVIRFNCPHCGVVINAKDRTAGKRGKCPGCARAVEVPPKGPTSPSKEPIFISYRREDRLAKALVGRFHEKLEAHYGDGTVFLDVDRIPPGQNFKTYLGDQISKCSLVLVPIGDLDDWLGRNADGRRRVDDERDFVRIEVEAALARDIPVVPLLLDGASMPSEVDLPPSLRELSSRHGQAIDTGRDFTLHTERLIRDLDHWYFGGVQSETPTATPTENSFDVVLTGFGDKKIPVIKVVRQLTGLNLLDTKMLVESAPATILKKTDRDKAQQVKAEIEAAGGSVELH